MSRWIVLPLLVGVGGVVGLVRAEMVVRWAPSHTRSYMVGNPVLHHRLRVNDARKVGGYALHVVGDNIRFPNLAIGMRYDLNHDRWHGPNNGNYP